MINTDKRLKLICLILSIVISIGFIPRNTCKADTKISYKMKYKEVLIKDGEKVRGIIRFEYPEFSGSSSSIVKINKMLVKKAKKYMESENAKDIEQSAKIGIKDKSFYDDETQYFYKTLAKVTYNDNSVISIFMSEQWYAGGVYNQSDYGYNYNIKTGKKLSMNDVITGKEQTVRKKIYASAKKFFKSRYGKDYEKSDWLSLKRLLDEYKIKDFKFYLTKGEAYICFGGYELNQCTSWSIFSVKS